MQVATPDGRPLRGDLITRVVLRTDLTPIPSTVEITATRTSVTTAAMQDRSIVLVGPHMIPYSIAHKEGDNGSDIQQDDRDVASFTVIGILASCIALGRRLQRSIIREGSTFAEIYRSIGATATVVSDFPVPVFGCYVGMLPTPEIARVLQEEAAAVFYADDKIQFARLDELITRPAAISIPKDRTEEIATGFMEKHSVPFVFTTDPSGKVVSSGVENARGVVYRPRTDARVMRNMGTALIQRRKMKQAFQPDLNAGTRIDIDGKPHIVITAAHAWATDQDENEPGEQSTYLWLGEVVK